MTLISNEKRDNPVGLNGLEFIEFTSPNPDEMRAIFKAFGFTLVAHHKSKKVELYQQGGVNIIFNIEKGSFGSEFAKTHGPSICAMGFRCEDSAKAQEVAIARGAKKFQKDESNEGELSLPAIYGIGDSLIYFIDRYGDKTIYEVDFNFIEDPEFVEGVGLEYIDHLTHNVGVGRMKTWCEFYEKIFNFREVRYFDIKGLQTGLISKVMLGPDNKICIPINEPTDPKSQIQEYIDVYKGEGIQHLAFKTSNIVKTLDAMRAAKVDFLEVPDTYYEDLPKRSFWNQVDVKEPIEDLRRLNILSDGDKEGYLLQIFTKNQFGPIFIEIIQREGHRGFGEGNFQALFDAVERDQKDRGVL